MVGLIGPLQGADGRSDLVDRVDLDGELGELASRLDESLAELERELGAEARLARTGGA